jgi:hypothetical protein
VYPLQTNAKGGRMKKAIYCFVMLILMLLSACSNELSRSKAAELIKSKGGSLYVYIIVNPRGGTMAQHGNIFLSLDQGEQLKRDGYLIGNSISDQAKQFTTQTADYTWQMNLATLDEVNITEITKPADEMGRRVCQVTYIAKYKPNTIGEKLNLDPNILSQSRRAFFVSTDRGWTFGGNN